MPNISAQHRLPPQAADIPMMAQSTSSASAINVHESSAVAPPGSPYAKQSRLAEHNIEHSLARLGNTRYQQIRPHEPEYYLRPVRRNAAIKTALRRLQTHKAEIEAFCKEIDAGNWGRITHRYMEDTYPDSENLHDIRTKDLLFFAFSAGRISRMEFGTAHMVLNLNEQFQEEIAPVYTGTANNVRTSMTLPSVWQDVEMHQLLTSDKSALTDEAEEYLLQIAGNLARWPGIFAERDEETWFYTLEQVFHQVPDNLQIFYKVPNVGSDPEGFWQRNICSRQMPLAAAPMLGNAAEKEFNEYFYSPSSALLHEFRKLLRTPVTQPTFCLGTTGVQQLAAMHNDGFHPVTILDDRVQSNYLAPHNEPSGVLISSMHDEHFHCMSATRYTPAQREMVCRTLPLAIERAARGAAPFEQALASRFIEFLADMACPLPAQMEAQDFLRAAFKSGFVRMMMQPTPQEEASFRLDQQENFLHFSQFARTCLNAIKSTRTGRGGLQRTLGEEMDWGRAEEMLKQMEINVLLA